MKESLFGFSKEDMRGRIDHTLLRQDATGAEIAALCREGVAGGVASVCIPPCFVRLAAGETTGRIAVCTVVGFPNGYMTAGSKAFETAEAVENGADEIDMVINLGQVKERRYDAVLDEIKQVKRACGGKLLKVIIETCLLTHEEKIEMCRVVAQSGAEFIKTSTGFSTGGATADDIRLMKQYGEGLRIKAAGGVRDVETAALFLSLGADRLGSSALLGMLMDAK